MKDHRIIAVDSHVPSAGLITWWRLSGDVDYAELTDAWGRAHIGFETRLPNLPSPSVALARTVGTLKGRHRLVRPYKRGFALVKEDEVEEGGEPTLDYDVLALIDVDQVGRLRVSGCAKEAADLLLSQLQATFDAAQNTLTSADISSWLTTMVVAFDAVGLRDRGGIYFIPQPFADLYSRFCLMLESVSNHQVHRVPAMHSDDAVRAILDAVRAEVDGEVANMERDLDDAQKPGARALKTRLARAEALDGKLARYEELLGVSLEGVRASVETLRANMTAAILTAEEMAAA